MIEYNSKSAMAWSRLGSRKVFGNVLSEVASTHNDLFAITADFGKSAGLTDFKDNFKDRYLDVGIAEQNMMGVAAGLALSGCNVFTFSFAPFTTMRCYEAIRSYIGYMNLNVKIIGMASGISLGYQGNTHYGLEDIALMRNIPNMTVISPADCFETVKTVEALADFEGPVYVRLTGLPGAMSVYTDDYAFKIGKGNILKQGSNVAVIAIGSLVSEVLRASRPLSKKGVDITVVNMHTIKPLDKELLENIISTHDIIYTVEEHSIVGGLGSTVAEFMKDNDLDKKLIRLGLPNKFLNVQKYQSMLHQYGLNGQGILKRITSDLQID